MSECIGYVPCLVPPAVPVAQPVPPRDWPSRLPFQELVETGSMFDWSMWTLQGMGILGGGVLIFVLACMADKRDRRKQAQSEYLASFICKGPEQ